MRPARPPLVLLVPAQTALVYDRSGWHLEYAPPQWWLDAQDERVADDERRRGVLTLVPPLQRRTTACRPGAGPCRRRHEHASQRRAI